MKSFNPWWIATLAVPLLVACSEPATGPGQAGGPSSPRTAETIESQAAVRGTATGRIESVDTQARTITISHGPVPALEWPAMTMTFQAPDVDLEPFGPGDEVAFDFETEGMAARIQHIRKR